MTDKKELKIEFAPGCFDNFEGTQEELDQMIAEVQNMFKGKTREELEAMSKPLDDEEFEELDEETKAQVLKALENEFGDQPKRRLQ